MTVPFKTAFALAMLVAVAPCEAEISPVFSRSGPDAASYGEAQDYPIPPQDQPFDQKTMVGWLSHYDRIAPKMRTVAKGLTVTPLKYATTESAPSLLGDYLDRNPVTGLLVAKGDTILYEHYRYGRTDKDRLLSYSMVKTLTGLLVGIARAEGAIRSLDDTAETYVPELAGSEYGATPIKALLHMASGVAFSETYRPDSDIYKPQSALLWRGATGALAALKQFNTRSAPAGTRFSYSSAETEVLGLVVSRAVHQPLADYLATRIWQKLGAESDAAWAIDPTGQEVAYCCFVAVLRDWARLGLMMAKDGMWNGQQVVPKEVLLEATTVSPGSEYLRFKSGAGYGNQVWLLPSKERKFALWGRYGQVVFVDPASRLVMVQTAVEMQTDDESASPKALALWQALLTWTSDVTKP